MATAKSTSTSSTILKKHKQVEFHDKYKILLEDAIDLDKKIIYLFDELQDNIGTILRVKYAALKLYWEEVKNKKFNDIIVDISSFGGSVYAIYAALDFYDELKNEDNVLVNTKAQGICMSAATVLLSGGTGIRTATKRCKFMLHDMQISDISGSATQVAKQMETIKIEQEELFAFYAQYTRKKGTSELTGVVLKKETKKWMDRFASNSMEHFISAKEALELGLCDRII